jgi:hypothetical protein
VLESYFPILLFLAIGTGTVPRLDLRGHDQAQRLGAVQPDVPKAARVQGVQVGGKLPEHAEEAR